MTRLEFRYRRLLRILPAAYRARWEDDMVATYLESVRTGDVDEDLYREDFGRPGISDALSIARLAVRVRLGASGEDPGPLLWGAALRSYALIGVVLFAAFGTVDLLSEFIRVGIVPWPLPSDTPQVAVGTGELVWRLASLTWVGVLLACLFGRFRVARTLAVIALLPAVLHVAGALPLLLRGSFLLLTVLSLTHLLISLTVVGALAAFHPEAPAPQRRPWLVAYAGAVVVLTVPSVVGILLHGVGRAPSLELAWLVLRPEAGLGLVFVVVAVRHLAGRSPHGSAWSLTLALVAGALTLQLVNSAYVWSLSFAGAAVAVAAHVAQPLVVGLLGVALAIRARRRWVLETSPG